MNLDRHLIVDPRGFSREAWLHGSANPTRLRIFLDAELYLERVNALDALPADGNYINLFVSSVDAATRHRDYACNSSCATYIATTVVDWARSTFPSITEPEHELCGLSLSGLQATFTALTHPGTFDKILCQSGSFWWNDEWLTQNTPSTNAKFWMSVGSQEVDKGISHPPTGLRQDVTQIDGVTRAVDALSASGATVNLNIYDGGHDPSCWSMELAAALSWLDAL